MGFIWEIIIISKRAVVLSDILLGFAGGAITTANSLASDGEDQSESVFKKLDGLNGENFWTGGPYL